ncbi:methionine-R-sulfoxide reductase [Cryptococcus amylolentus CBS 6039]|uniref:Peptide-methionine (R)-S-oxide reductase n=2 Tax=Cryptococcus amylolentus TaxID=104669 RepID=A0A1E3I456_9TREE|nr:methionine-R-sulfoxide reductase [Cryptococcus amylolentus CBS 6039]ODN83414.1 methionine-R-sulfoxide reductase [Cryptococcus amylolentus CBS 6039]
MPFISPAIYRSTVQAARTRLPTATARSTAGITLPFALFSSSAPTNDMSSQPKVQKSEDEWHAVLSPEQFRVLREKGTERPGSSPYDHSFDNGVYHCAGCDAPLYTSKTKFQSGCGWPAFYDTVPGAVNRHEDRTLGMTRTEITCNNCGGHLGHVFKGERFGNPIDERHCVNGISLNFKKE